MTFKLACAQFAPKKGDLDANLTAIASTLVQAHGLGVGLVIFPEASTSGYFLEGGVLESSLTAKQLCTALESRLEKSGLDLDFLVGFYESWQGNLYNAAAYFSVQNGKLELIHVYRKFFLPTYGVFDESRFVSRGQDLGVFQTRFGKVGVLVCEDIWHSIMPTLVALKGARLVLVPSASPGRGFGGEQVESLGRYHRIMAALAEEHGLWAANCQLCGFEGGKGFAGGSIVFDPFGKAVAESPILEPHLLVTEVDMDLVSIARSASPLLADLESAWGDISRLVKEIEL